jgi:hypothetical protein
VRKNARGIHHLLELVTVAAMDLHHSYNSIASQYTRTLESFVFSKLGYGPDSTKDSARLRAEAPGQVLPENTDSMEQSG